MNAPDETTTPTTPMTRAEIIKRRGPAPMTWPEIVAAFWSRTKSDATTGCLNYTGAKKPMGNRSKKVYGVVRILDRAVGAHCFAYELVKGLIPSWLVVAHDCDNGLCVNPAHLHLITQEENMREARLRKRFPSGENASCVKLDAVQVLLIRNLYYSMLLDISELEKLFAMQNLQPLLRGEHWPEVLMPPYADGVDQEKLHRINNGRAQSSISFETACLVHELRSKGMLTKDIAKIVGVSPNRVAVLVRKGTTAFEATNPEMQKQIFLAAERIQASMWHSVAVGELKQKIAEEVSHAITVKFGCNFLGYPNTGGSSGIPHNTPNA